MSLEELQKEACKFQLPVVPKDRERCIELLSAHLEKHGPLRDLQYHRQVPDQAEGLPRPSTPGSPTSAHSDQDFYTVRRGPPFSVNAFEHLCTVLSDQLKLQSEAMRQQQQLLQQVVSSLAEGQGVAVHQARHVAAPSSSSIQDRPPFSTSAGAECSIASTGNAVKFLSSQIPTYGATEEEDIELWIEKIESVAEIHHLSAVVMLSAAAAKLTKAARRWFDLSSGEINRSWLCFRTAILDRFKKKILYDVVRRKAEARKWIPSS